MKYAGIPYEALGADGAPVVRDARVISELPTTADRLMACILAARTIARDLGLPAPPRILFGVPVYESFGMTWPQAKAHPQATLLLQIGADLPLTYCG